MSNVDICKLHVFTMVVAVQPTVTGWYSQNTEAWYSKVTLEFSYCMHVYRVRGHCINTSCSKVGGSHQNVTGVGGLSWTWRHAYNKLMVWILQLLLPDKSISHQCRQKANTALPILTENLIVKDTDTSKSSDKNVCSPSVWTENRCSKCLDPF